MNAAPTAPEVSPPAAGEFCDAHNHLQDDRFAGRQEELIAAARAAGVARMVVNGACAEDWPLVAELARRHPDLIVPSFGWHPWYLAERPVNWLGELERWLEVTPNAVVGEIGLDRWMLENPDRWRTYRGDEAVTGEPPPLKQQEEVFIAQLRLAAARNVPVTIHCLQCFGRLRELLAANPRPVRGFLLHSYGGSAELVPEFAKLGAYFSFPGYFLHERKARQREVFRAVPPDRLLVETDAPDQLPPEPRRHLRDPRTGRVLNHPANLPDVVEGLAACLSLPVGALAAAVRENFRRLFGT